MIWFTCKSCGKTHNRPDADAGVTLFCDCGRALTVPWNSTAAPAEEPPVPVERIPTARPVEEEPGDLPEAIPVPRPRVIPLADDDEDDRPRRRSQHLPPSPPAAEALPSKKKRTIKRANPAYCFNHDEDASQAVCDDCKLSFCHACVIGFQGKTLCGPCKQFRLRPRSLPTQLSGWAVVAVIVGFVSGPVGFCLSTLPLTAVIQGRGSVGLAIVAALVALVPAGVACYVGRRALHQLDREPMLSGRGLALTGTLAGLLSALWCVTVAVVTILKPAQ